MLAYIYPEGTVVVAEDIERAQALLTAAGYHEAGEPTECVVASENEYERVIRVRRWG